MAKFNIKFIESLQPKDKPYLEYDDTLPAFCIKVYPTGTKSWKVIKRPKGAKPVTVTLGTFPDMSLYVAKKLAQDNLAVIGGGVNPNVARAKEKSTSITLEEAYQLYLSTHVLESSTLDDYKKAIYTYLGTWTNTQLASITPQDILNKHAEIKTASDARANGSMRVLRAIYNYAYKTMLDESRQPLLPPNPVNILSTARRWSKNKRKKTLVRASELSLFFKKLHLMRNEMKTVNAFIYYAYIRTMLFTGLRGDELRRLTTSKQSALNFDGAKGYYDQSAQLLYFFDQKNHEEIEIPLSTQGVEAVELVYNPGNYWLFRDSETHEMLSFDKTDSAFKWLKRNDFPTSGHDLRRTYITIAEALDISEYTYKRLVGHKVQNSQDVTAGYVISSNDRLRRAAQSVSDYIAGFEN